MADYSEFPTTPTAWQEIAALEDRGRSSAGHAPPGGRLGGADPRADLHRPGDRADDRYRVLFRTAGWSGWPLMGCGVALLVSELRKVRRKR